MSPSIFQWVFFSTVAEESSERLDERNLTFLLKQARARNTKLGITGILLHADGRFMQILEGSRADVEKLSKIIIKDPRHKDVTTLRFGYKPARDFSDWKMGYARIDPGKWPDGYIPILDKYFSTSLLTDKNSESYYFVDTFRRRHSEAPGKY